MFAIIENGGKQYKAAIGDVLRLEKLDAEVGAKVELNVLMVSDEGSVTVGKDAASYTAVAEVLSQEKLKKIVVFKYKPKKNIRKKQGHRQPFTAVKVLEVTKK